MPYSQRTPQSCGPDAIGYVLAQFGLAQAQVDGAWGIGRIEDFGDLQDSPWHHFAVLEKLGMAWVIRTCDDILAGKCAPEKTVCLVHNPESPLLKQHYVVVVGSDANRKHVFAHWGDGSPRPKQIGWGPFQTMYSGGKWIGPQCAYEVVPKGTPGSQSRLSWYQRLWASVTGRF